MVNCDSCSHFEREATDNYTEIKICIYPFSNYPLLNPMDYSRVNKKPCSLERSKLGVCGPQGINHFPKHYYNNV